MRAKFEAVRKLLTAHTRSYHYPKVVYTGDVFHDGWRERAVPPELINFLIKEMPRGYAVPGQHDLPYHRYEDKQKSAYWTLCEARVLTDLRPGEGNSIGFGSKSDRIEAVLFGFPWGTVQQPFPGLIAGQDLRVAVVHDYCWVDGHSFPNAPAEKYALEQGKRLKGFNVALFGDNHRPFTSNPANSKFPNVCNIGSFLKRNADEMGVPTTVALVHKSGSVSHVPLDCPADEWLVNPDLKPVEGPDLFKKFADKIDQLTAVSADLKAVCEQVLREAKADKSVHEDVLNILVQAKAKRGS